MFKASALEFRFRFLIHAVIYVLAFWAPWDYLLHLDTGLRPRQIIATWLTRNHWLGFEAATIAVTIAAIAFALAGAIFRTCGAAYLSTSVVKAPSLHGTTVVADGPYRHVRNPLYLGTWLHTFALAMLMPPTGAIFAIIVIGIEQLRLIFAEEAFLAEKLGPPYLSYKATVPRLWPSLLPRVPASDTRPDWPKAFLGEIYMWGVVLSFAIMGWRYNVFPIIQGVLISLGVSLIARAFIASPQATADEHG
jgi:protein-S-isoprenylcysteine O-methyltransferase Ste14